MLLRTLRPRYPSCNASLRPWYRPFNATLYLTLHPTPHRDGHQHMGSIEGAQLSPCISSYMDSIEGREASLNDNALKASTFFRRVVIEVEIC